VRLAATVTVVISNRTGDTFFSAFGVPRNSTDRRGSLRLFDAEPGCCDQPRERNQPRGDEVISRSDLASGKLDEECVDQNKCRLD
jgi:hypothetical protein